MCDLKKLLQQRDDIARQLRMREKQLLEPYVGEKCLSTTFSSCVSGTVESLPADDIPASFSKKELYQIVLRDEDWRSLQASYAEIDSQFTEYLESRDLTVSTKKEKIIQIKKEYGHAVSNTDIARLVGCSSDYARKFSPSFSDDNAVREQRPTELEVNEKLRQEILTRDGSCVRCQSESNLEVHHIIPVRLEGEAIAKNLATLCHECHMDIHKRGLQYRTLNEFWSMVDSPSGDG